MGKSSKSRHDTAVQGTNDSSIVSKASAAAKGYTQDRYVQYFSAKQAKRSPLINRNYYIRYKAVELMFNQFLSAHPGEKLQVLSLGAGFDALYFNLKAEGKLHNVLYMEVDYQDVMERKSALIAQTPVLSDMLTLEQRPYNQGIVLQSSQYVALGVDLTKLTVLQQVLSKLGVDYTAPTMFMSEVALTYLKADSSSAVIKWSADMFPNAVFWSYEQILPYDGFGCVMMNHFRKIGSPLQTIDTYPTVSDQIHRHFNRGWEECLALDLNSLYRRYLSRAERHRVAAIEPFEEWEECHLAFRHYMVMTATKGTCNEVLQRLLSMRDAEKIVNVVAESAGSVDLTDGKINVEERLDSLDLTDGKNDIDDGNESPNCDTSKQGNKLGSDELKTTDVDEANCDSVEQAGCDIKDLSTVNGHAFYAVKPVKMAENAMRGEVLDIGRLQSGNGAQGTALENTAAKFQADGIEQTWFKRFGHSCTQIGNEVFVVGGFGERGNCHGRLSEILRFDVKSGDVFPCTALWEGGDGKKGVERLFHSSTLLPDGRMCVFGGRMSPHKLCPSMVLLERDEKDSGWNVEEIEVTETEVLRWRHTANLVKIEGEWHILVYGGCSVKTEVLGDSWILNLKTWEWNKLTSSNEGLPPPRHSHTTNIRHDTPHPDGATGGQLIVACGLGADVTPLSCIWAMSSPGAADNVTWQQLRIGGLIAPRYSHTSDILNNKLFLLGGVTLTSQQPGLTIIDLDLLTSRNFSLPVQNPEFPVLLYGHQVAYTDDERRHLVVIGGGGNCFSFGTHLNDLHHIVLPSVE